MRVLLLLLLLHALPALACPGCMPVALTFVEEVEMAGAVALARPMPEAKSRFRLERIFKGEAQAGKVVAAAAAGSPGLVVLTTAAEPANPFWTGKPRPADEDVIHFVAQAVELPSRFQANSLKPRLDFLQPYLGHANLLLADAAYGEFSQAPYVDLMPYARSIGSARLRTLISRPTTPITHLSLYYMLLGMLGQPADLDLIEPRVQKAAKQTSPPGNLSALLTCYLHLKRSAGLPYLEKAFLKGRPAHRFAALSALGIHGNNKSPLTRGDISKIYRNYIGDVQAGTFVLQDLALWGDWSVLEQVGTVFRRKPEDVRLRVAVIRYLRTCPQPRARDILQELHKIDPSLVNAVRRPFTPNP